MMEFLAVMSGACTGLIAFNLGMMRLAAGFERRLNQRIARPRWPHAEYRLWLAALIFPAVEVWLLMVVIMVYAWWAFGVRPNFAVAMEPHSPFPQVFVFLAGGLAIFVLPMIVFGIFYDRRIRADGPEPPAEAAEVKAFRVYLIAALSVLVVLVVAAAILLAVA